MSITLFRTLIRTSLAIKDAESSDILSSATELEWQQTFANLELHRLLPLVFYGLKTHGLSDIVPQHYLALMQRSYRQTQKINTRLLRTLERILKAMLARNLHPTLWKGIVLADSFYPDLATRSMEDIDFAIPPDELEPATDVFQALGFLLKEDDATDDAVYFEDAMGVMCDVHHRVRLFEGKESLNLTCFLPSQHMTAALPTLEPNAMVVLLIVHMDGHRGETGRLLSWMLDLAFVIQKWGNLLDLQRIETLLPQEHFVSLFRTVRFLQQEFNQPIPPALAPKALGFEPFTLASVLRERRLTLWGLPRPRGWMRLGASRLGFRSKRDRPYPNLSDLLLWPADALQNLRMNDQPIHASKFW